MFIVIDGIDGTGKSTQLKILSEKLSEKNLKHILTHEPQKDSIYGKQIYKILTTQDISQINQNTLLELYIRDREKHINEIITPNLLKGNIVITDRYYHSSIAYQGENIDPYIIYDKNKQFPKPDVVFIILSDVMTANKRLSEKDTFEQNLQYQNSIQERYKLMHKYTKDNIIYINESSIKSIYETIWRYIEIELKRRNII